MHLWAVNLLCAVLTCLTFSVSMYTDVGHTFSGYWTRQGVAACGPSYLGAVVIVEKRAYICADRGGLVTDAHIDLWHHDEDEAWEFGRKELLVGVIR
jgi:3D (Asp-Asp-Asp) domain-containing protein